MGKTVVYSKQTTTTKQINDKEQLSVGGTEAKLHPPGMMCGSTVKPPGAGLDEINSLSVERLVPGLLLKRLHKWDLSDPHSLLRT